MKHLRKGLVLLFAFMVVWSVPAGPVGQAAADHECTIGHSMFLSITNTADLTDNDLGCQLFHGDKSVDQSLESNEQETEIYKSAQTDNEHTNIHKTTFDNYLKDAQTIALIKGKNAYIRSLNNGSSESAARTDAREAVKDYYSVKQINLAETWSASIANWEYLEDVSDSDSGINDTYVVPHIVVQTAEDVRNIKDGHDMATVNDTVTLSNGSSYNVTKVDVHGVNNGYEYEHLNSGTWYGHNETVAPIGPTTGTVVLSAADLTGLMVRDYEGGTNHEIMKFNDYATRWSNIESNQSAALNEIDTFVNNTYSGYQEGDVNNSELIDPYVAHSEYAPNGSFEAWSMMQLSLLKGATPPKDLDKVGNFNVTTESGRNYTGMLLSDENPASGQFENETTYDASSIPGPQYVVTADSIRELTGNFTIDEITDSNGNAVQNVTVREVNYSTADTQEYQQLLENLSALRAEIDARQAASSGGGGAILGDANPIVVGALAMLGILILRERGG